VERGGARRWILLGGFGIQPAEIVKLTAVLFLARWISRHGDRMKEFSTGVLPLLLLIGGCCGLMLLQPDFGTAVILAALLFLMLFVSSARPLHLLVLGGFGVAAFGLMATLAEYRMRRLLCFMDPWEHSQGCGFQLTQSLIAIGSGGVSGIGLGQSRQKMFFLPEAHTDFIFALIGEELGLCGAVVVLTLFAVIAARGFRIASRHPDPFASLLAFGLTLVVVLGAVVNVGVVVGLLPTKGLPLPFVSYGGSAMLAAMIEIGMLAALSRMTG
jgi:cell division protein FtsW